MADKRNRTIASDPDLAELLGEPTPEEQKIIDEKESWLRKNLANALNEYCIFHPGCQACVLIPPPNNPCPRSMIIKAIQCAKKEES